MEKKCQPAAEQRAKDTAAEIDRWVRLRQDYLRLADHADNALALAQAEHALALAELEGAIPVERVRRAPVSPAYPIYRMRGVRRLVVRNG